MMLGLGRYDAPISGKPEIGENASRQEALLARESFVLPGRQLVRYEVVVSPGTSV
jgi:hypothetical protein